MTVYWLTFDVSVDDVNTVSGATRRAAIYTAIYKATGTNGAEKDAWKDPTSFIMFKSSKSIDDIAASIKAVISQRHDMFLIRKLDNKKAIVCGNFKSESVFGLMMDDKKTYLTDITDDSEKSEARKLNASLRKIDEDMS